MGHPSISTSRIWELLNTSGYSHCSSKKLLTIRIVTDVSFSPGWQHLLYERRKQWNKRNALLSIHCVPRPSLVIFLIGLTALWNSISSSWFHRWESWIIHKWRNMSICTESGFRSRKTVSEPGFLVTSHVEKVAQIWWAHSPNQDILHCESYCSTEYPWVWRMLSLVRKCSFLVHVAFGDSSFWEALKSKNLKTVTKPVLNIS